MQILGDELHQVVEMWNQHLIASSKFGNSGAPRRRPGGIFFLPHLFDSEDYKVPVVSDEIDEFLNKSTMCAEDCSKRV